MHTMTAVYLLRHAESQFDPHIPEPDWLLSARGSQQAEQLTTHLVPLAIDVIYASPYARAVATVSPFAHATGLTIERVEDLRERKLTPGSVENWREVVQHAWQHFDFAFPHCESSAQCQARMVRILRHLVQEQAGKVLLVSSHGNAIALYLHALDSSYGFDNWVAMRNPEVFRISYHGTEPGWDQTFTWKGFAYT
jgi:2,3-bisphosphoglycerate-dependent phosphoglycerate mutase